MTFETQEACEAFIMQMLDERYVVVIPAIENKVKMYEKALSNDEFEKALQLTDEMIALDPISYKGHHLSLGVARRQPQKELPWPLAAIDDRLLSRNAM